MQTDKDKCLAGEDSKTASKLKTHIFLLGVSGDQNRAKTRSIPSFILWTKTLLHMNAISALWLNGVYIWKPFATTLEGDNM